MTPHEFRGVPFTTGVVSVAVAAGVFFSETTSLSPRYEWLLPVALVGAGVAGIVHVLQHDRAEQAGDPGSETSGGGSGPAP